MTDVPAPLSRNRDFRALWTGQTVSALGTSISSLAYPLLVLAVTGSPALAGLVGTVLAAVTFALRIPASAVADRMDRKRLMLVCDAGRCLAVGSLAVAVLLDSVALAHVLLVAVAEAAFGVLFAPAEAVAVRRVVPVEQLGRAVAVNQSRQQLAALVGPTAGGALFGLARGLPFAADALSYLVSFVAIATVRTPLSPDRAARPRQGLGRELLEGLRWLWEQQFLRAACLWLSAAGLLFPSLGLVTLVLATDLGAPPAQIGLAFTITGAGGLVGALLAPRLVARLSLSMLLAAYAWIAVAATFLLLLADSVWVLGVLGALAFLPVPAVNAAITARVMARAPDAIQGRAVSATTQLTTLLHPVGPAVVGVLLQAIGARPTVLLYGGAFVVLALLATLLPALRRSV